MRGPWILKSYFKEDHSPLTPDGWFDTGDIGTLDPDGYMEITDRAKDVIKSGGEWISSSMLENAALGHPQVAQAAVIGVPHERNGWNGRCSFVSRAARRPPLRNSMFSCLSACRSGGCPTRSSVSMLCRLGRPAKFLKTKLREKFKAIRLR